MINEKIKRTFGISIALAALILSGSIMIPAQSSRDPFQKNPVYKKKDRPVRAAVTRGGGSAPAKPKKLGPHVVDAPSAEARIAYFRQIREREALAGRPIPKPTSVMLLDELSVMGIFRTPRGYAAIVKAEPINLSYTIYPGERFFDGQLVAVEENRLIFRKVTKWSTGKFVSSVENKALRKYSNQQTIQGTAPADSYKASAKKPKADDKEAAPAVVMSPLEEMRIKANEEPAKSASKGKSKKRKSSRKRPKVAKKN